ncbi:MAG: alpha-glucosidase/alpha-galactosidase [Clostridia bacterium]|nr:alpha-glucosidase/alpha-galactosidase [Clostridia bacterium]
MKDVKNVQIAYIGGGSRAWARNLMNDLAKDGEIAGCVRLYDIDMEAAKLNEKIGNRLSARDDIAGKWNYKAYENIGEALTGADFVFISILPGDFDDMASDVHAPEEYGIYQPVGDTTGPGGIIRSLRTLPMIRDIAFAVKEYCPKAWVINFTNPMTTITRTLYKVFPEIKAFGCCHEVFGTQKLFVKILEEKFGIKAKREDVRVNVVGVNHFTFLTEAKYKGMDLIPLYDEYINEHPDGLERTAEMMHWANGRYLRTELVKFTLFKRYGVVAAAGDRHLAEFCPGYWFLHDQSTITDEYGFALTAVEWRKEEQAERIQRQLDDANGEEFKLYNSGEEMVQQIKALLGLGDFVTNVNIPNIGQVPNNPIGAVVETNAFFSGDSVRPVFAGEVPLGVNALVMRIIEEQEMVVDAALNGDYEKAFVAFMNNPNVCLPVHDARTLFDKMLYNVKDQLPYYEQYIEQRKTGFQH